MIALDSTCLFSPKRGMFSSMVLSKHWGARGCRNLCGVQNCSKKSSEPWDCWGCEQLMLVLCLLNLYPSHLVLPRFLVFVSFFFQLKSVFAGDICGRNPTTTIPAQRPQVSPHAALAWQWPALPHPRAGGSWVVVAVVLSIYLSIYPSIYLSNLI